MAYDIQDKVALVTGANRGIGEQIVKTFIEQGVSKIYAAVRQPDSVQGLIDTYGDTTIIPLQVDLRYPETIMQAAMAAPDVQVVVNNAGIFEEATPLSDTAAESLEKLMTVNVYGLIHMAQAFAPVLKTNGGGVFIQINSLVSIKTFTEVSTYCASKAAAYSITQGLREELSRQNTAVISVHPGPIATDMGREAGFDEIAEPATVVADSIINAFKDGDFHTFPDAMAKEVSQLYQGYGKAIIESAMTD